MQKVAILADSIACLTPEMEQIASEFNCVELWLSDFSPIMGYATGTGVLAIAFYNER